TTKPWRGYKVCETIWNAWPKDRLAGKQTEALTARSKTSWSPREGTRPTIIPRESACVVGPVPSPGGFFNGLLAIQEGTGGNRANGCCVIFTQTPERGVGTSLVGVQLRVRVDRSDGVYGTGFGMSPSPAGRKNSPSIHRWVLVRNPEESRQG